MSKFQSGRRKSTPPPQHFLSRAVLRVTALLFCRPDTRVDMVDEVNAPSSTRELARQGREHRRLGNGCICAVPDPSSQRGHRYSLEAQDADDLAWRIQVLFENMNSLESRNPEATTGLAAYLVGAAAACSLSSNPVPWGPSLSQNESANNPRSPIPSHFSCNDPDPNVTLCLWDLHQAELVCIQPEAREASSKRRMIGLAIAGYVERHRAPQTYFVDHFNVGMA
ncbi:uncharacterized protein B0T23DRAFT_394783 [Neurospora hispaniola]|uniref:Uncharacterized protein n=1 Tax=Neurospora hispaniola TaxID=588809 RepID=A0AAJ0I9W5_9PEZI|nr:hypothetical protein B0T23DRAFT_394783 [Neurospora hispaniola]